MTHPTDGHRICSRLAEEEERLADEAPAGSYAELFHRDQARRWRSTLRATEQDMTVSQRRYVRWLRGEVAAE